MRRPPRGAGWRSASAGEWSRVDHARCHGSRPVGRLAFWGTHGGGTGMGTGGGGFSVISTSLGRAGLVKRAGATRRLRTRKAAARATMDPEREALKPQPRASQHARLQRGIEAATTSQSARPASLRFLMCFLLRKILVHIHSGTARMQIANK